MTVVEATAPATAPADTDAPDPTAGFAGLLGTVDHVGLGRLWIVASLLFLLVAGVAGGLVGVERLDPAEVDLLEGALPELFNLHATAAIFLFLVPAFLGVATAVVPLQVGAATVAFPRAAAAAFWTWLLSGGVLLASYAVDGGPAGTDVDGRLLWAIGLGGVLVSLVLATVCVLTTIWSLRTAGMGLARVPAFTWSMLVGGTVWLLSLPVLLSGVVLFYLESQYDVPLDAGALLRWAFGPPQVFAFALPALGLLLDAVPVSAGVRARHHGVLLGAVGAFGLLTFGGDLVESGHDPAITQDFLYVAVAFAIVLPLLAIAGGVADTLRAGKPKLTSPLLFGIASLLAFLAAGVTGAVRAADNLDLVGTTADTAVAHLALGAGAIGLVGALHHWSSKLFGAVLSEGLGKAAALLLLLGGVLLAGPDLVSGFLDQAAGLPPGAQVEDGVEAMNLLSLAGGVVLLLGVLLVLVNLVGAAARGSDDEVPADPWGTGQTLEWRTASPPAPGGPGPIDPVTSATPLLDARDAQEASA